MVYIERGTRLVAVRLASYTGWGLLPLHVRRPSTSWKRGLTPVLRRLPRGLKDLLRRFEQWRTFSKRGTREVLPITGEVDLAGRDILIVDSAANSGSSMMAARSWVIGRGADPGAHPHRRADGYDGDGSKRRGLRPLR